MMPTCLAGYHCRRPRFDGQILATHVRHQEGEIWFPVSKEVGVRAGGQCLLLEVCGLESDTGERAGNKSLLEEAEPAERRDFADATLV